MRADIGAAQKSLHAVVQILIQRDFRDGRVDPDLQLRPVELAQRLLDDPVALLIGVNEQRVVDRVGRDAHTRQDRALVVSPPAEGAAGAESAAGAGAGARPPEGSAAARHDIVRV